MGEDRPASGEPELRKTRRRLPHWSLAEGVYFITFRLARGSLAPEERGVVLEHIRSGRGRYYRLGAVVVMPDHVHLILRPEAGYSLSRIMKGIKGASARMLNQRQGATGVVWQDESWDRILRDEDELHRTLEYLAGNPLRAGLCESPEDYPWLFVAKDF